MSKNTIKLKLKCPHKKCGIVFTIEFQTEPIYTEVLYCPFCGKGIADQFDCLVETTIKSEAAK